MLNNNKVKIQGSLSHTNNGTCRLWLNVPFTFHGTLDKIKLFYRIHGEDRGGSEGGGVGAGIGMTLWNLRPIRAAQGWCSSESTSLQPMWPSLGPSCRRHIGKREGPGNEVGLHSNLQGNTIIRDELLVSSLLCYKRSFSGYSGFPLSLKTYPSKFTQPIA